MFRNNPGKRPAVARRLEPPRDIARLPCRASRSARTRRNETPRAAIAGQLRSRGDNTTVGQPNRAIGLLGQAQVVSHHDYSEPLLDVQAAQQRQNLAARALV